MGRKVRRERVSREEEDKEGRGLSLGMMIWIEEVDGKEEEVGWPEV